MTKKGHNMLIDGIQFTSTATVTGIDREKTLSQPGELVLITGAARWYPSYNISILSIKSSINTASIDADVVIEVKKNSVTVSTMTIAANSNVGSATIVTPIDLDTTDYVTVDITQIGTNAADLTVQVGYETR